MKEMLRQRERDREDRERDRETERGEREKETDRGGPLEPNWRYVPAILLPCVLGV